MKKSETIDKLATALALAHTKFDDVKKDSENPYFKSNYANLETVISCTKRQLADEGISVLQFPSFKDGMVHVETMLLHKSGEYITGDLSLRPENPQIQKLASAITYARRYSLTAALNLCGKDEDDDGNAAGMQSQKKPVNAAPAKPSLDPKAKYDNSNNEHRLFLNQILNHLGIADSDNKKAMANCIIESGVTLEGVKSKIQELMLEG